MGCKDFTYAQQLLVTAKSMLGEILSGMIGIAWYNTSCFTLFLAVEFLDTTCMDLVERHLGLHNPISTWPIYVLVETSGSNEEHDMQASSFMIDMNY